MKYILEDTAAPLFAAPPYRSEKHPDVLPPKTALPLAEALKERQMGPLSPKPYRILTNIRSISSCAHQNAAIDRSDTLWTWGAVLDRQDGFVSINYGMPQNIEYVPKKRMEHVLSVSVGAWHTVCITKDNKLWGWGENACGELGLGDFLLRTEPTFIMDDVKRVFATVDQTYAIKMDGSLWGWGENRNGTLLGAPEDCSTPFHIMDHVECITSGDGVAMAVTERSELWAWGRNIGGMIHCAGLNDKYSMPIHLLSGIKSVSLCSALGAEYSFFISRIKELYAMGDDIGALLTHQQRAEKGKRPVKVMERIRAVYPGVHFSLLLTEDGQLLSYGDNSVGQCGTGRSTGRIKKPRQIMFHVIEAACGYCHSMALQENGDLWIWGGDFGQLKTEEDG